MIRWETRSYRLFLGRFLQHSLLASTREKRRKKDRPNRRHGEENRNWKFTDQRKIDEKDIDWLAVRKGDDKDVCIADRAQ